MRGELCFGVVVDRDLVDDAWPLAEELGRAQEELLALVAGGKEQPAGLSR